MSIFGAPTQAIIKGDTLPIALIKIGSSVKNLPVIEISELSHTIRQQTDCSLDGNVHILTAAGGVATCKFTVMDCIESCPDAETLDSVLQEYSNIKNKPGEHKITVQIMNRGSLLSTFEGYIGGCNARATISKDTTFVVATLTATGIWK